MNNYKEILINNKFLNYEDVISIQLILIREIIDIENHCKKYDALLRYKDNYFFCYNFYEIDFTQINYSFEYFIEYNLDYENILIKECFKNKDISHVLCNDYLNLKLNKKEINSKLSKI